MNDINKIREQIRVNPNAVLHVWPKYAADAFTSNRDELLWGWNPNANGGEVVLKLGRYPLHFVARPGEPAMEEPRSSFIYTPGPPAPAKMKHWGLTKLGPSVWTVSPSVHLPDAFHGYVTLCEVPDPAPWEAKEAGTLRCFHCGRSVEQCMEVSELPDLTSPDAHNNGKYFVCTPCKQRFS